MEQAEDRLASLGRRYRPALIAFFLRRLGNLSEAEDLTQEVLARMFEMQEGAVGHSDAYIFTIASNLVRDRYRRQQVRDAYRADANYTEPHADYVDPLRVLEARERLGVVSKAIAELSQRSRDILLLFRLERMKKRDIAESYGISVSAVDKHLIKATAHITKRLESGE